MRKILAMLFMVFATSAWAYYTETVNGITWTYTVSDGKATIGSGSSSITAVPQSTKGAINIPPSLGGKPVTSIGSFAFSWCVDITSVTIPDSVTGIGYSAFECCSSLTSMTIPSNVTEIEERVFWLQQADERDDSRQCNKNRRFCIL